MKRFLLILSVIMVVLAGCGQEEKNDRIIEKQKQEIAILEKDISELKNEKELLTNEVADIKVDNGTAKYIMTLEIKQSHFLDVGKMIKDEINAIEIQIPVDKEYFDSFEVGDKIDDSFRFGSFLLEGSIGNWNIKVIDKEIK